MRFICVLLLLCTAGCAKGYGPGSGTGTDSGTEAPVSADAGAPPLRQVDAGDASRDAGPRPTPDAPPVVEEPTPADPVEEPVVEEPVEDSGPVIVFNEQSYEIPDNDPVGINDTVSVEEDFEIETVIVDVRIDHPYNGDLIIALEHGGYLEVIYDGTFDGGGSDVYETFVLSSFAGMSSAGDYTLYVSDNLERDEGVLLDWALTVQ